MIFDVMCHLPSIFMREIYVLRNIATGLLSARKQAQESEIDICSHLVSSLEREFGGNDEED
jgi:hypothetical protein